MSTIRDVAEQAGVSVSTVSRALSGRAFVEEETKARVMRAVQELDYKPNAVAKGLREGRMKIIVLVVPNIGRFFVSKLVNELTGKIESDGYSLIVSQSNGSLEGEKETFRMLASLNPAGVVCMTVCDELQHIVDFEKRTGIPVVLINRNTCDALSTINSNTEEIGYNTVKYLNDRGHKKIAAVYDDLSRQGPRERYKGYKEALEDLGLSDCSRYFIFDAANPETAYFRTLELLDRPDPPTAIIIDTDSAIMGVYKAIVAKGLKIPEDVSVFSRGENDIVEHIMPPLTASYVSFEELTKETLRIMRKYWGGDTTPESVMLENEVLERESVAPPKDA